MVRSLAASALWSIGGPEAKNVDLILADRRRILIITF